jgi:hypothetical protein
MSEQGLHLCWAFRLPYFVFGGAFLGWLGMSFLVELLYGIGDMEDEFYMTHRHAAVWGGMLAGGCSGMATGLLSWPWCHRAFGLVVVMSLIVGAFAGKSGGYAAMVGYFGTQGGVTLGCLGLKLVQCLIAIRKAEPGDEGCEVT